MNRKENINNNFFKNFLGKTGFNSKPINSFEDEEDDEELSFENQKAALASFAFNIGPSGFKNSDVVKILNTGDYKGAAEELLKYNKSKGRFSQGLYNRRKKERELFLTPDD